MSMRRNSNGALTTMNVIGILALFCTMSEFAILTPSIAAFSHHFADTDITTIMLANSITGRTICTHFFISSPHISV